MPLQEPGLAASASKAPSLTARPCHRWGDGEESLSQLAAFLQALATLQRVRGSAGLHSRDKRGARSWGAACSWLPQAQSALGAADPRAFCTAPQGAGQNQAQDSPGAQPRAAEVLERGMPPHPLAGIVYSLVQWLSAPPHTHTVQMDPALLASCGGLSDHLAGSHITAPHPDPAATQRHP